MNTIPKYKSLRQQLLSSYQNIFENQKSLGDIHLVWEALKNGTPFLQTRLSADGTQLVSTNGQPAMGSSFSSIFLPFHIGQEYPLNVRQILSGMTGTEPLITFMERCAKLENLTEQFAHVKTESAIQNKEEIIRELQMFIEKFPSLEVFKQWISALNEESA